MQYELLKYLRCPITKTKLRFELIREFEKEYFDLSVLEIRDGILFSENGFVFPIIDGIPRMLLEAFYDYSEFFETHLPNYQQTKLTLEANYKELFNYCSTKNRKTKDSFEFEWSFLNSNKNDKIWHQDISDLVKVFAAEVDERIEYFNDKKVIDIGCGHGFMTSKVGEISKLAVGIELSRSVEKAYLNNKCQKAWYVQGDLQFLPFDDSTFDLLYCSGVIHHTNNTELSLLLIESIIKNNGKICLWLYHPQNNRIHNIFLGLRKFTKRMPPKFSFFFLSIFVFPVSYLIKRLKRKNAPNYREEIIDLLDQFTPEFRFETPHELAKIWLKRKKYTNIRITTEDKFGFSIVGDKTTANKVLTDDDYAK